MSHQFSSGTVMLYQSLKTTIGFLVLALLVACGPDKNARPITSSLPQASSEQARIYFYRSKVPFLAAVQPEFLVNGKAVGTAVLNQVFFRDALPGNYEIQISSHMKKILPLTLKPGETYYIRAFGTTSVIRTYLTIEEVSEEEALEDLKGQKLLP
ncbi:DUF2846 domain-containing protein [Kiloniella laminariae]|uniref:DUF2846 domain-containing protein n=2 Tax=Kiloniella laminariae TaxID=454162 RepID=A0ABT4LKX2_9PROT|nr:DUF2846 domain-containing protein [Kiloniella laminariae]